jgi:hypothetical protein
MTTNELLDQLDRWQAVSHPLLTNRKPEELFDADFAQRYSRLQSNLWLRIARLHGTLLTLEELSEFPFQYLYVPGDMEFWKLTFLNFFDVAILKLHGLVNDSGFETLTLNSFRSEIIKAPWRCQDARNLLRQTLEERSFDGLIKSIAKRVDVIRDGHIAHSLIDKQSGNPKEIPGTVTIKEVRQLFDAAHRLFGALSFGSGYGTLAGDLMPCTVGGKPKRTCLERVLDAVLRDSDFVNRPERRKTWWEMDRAHMNPDTLRAMNDLRKRVGLPEA